MQVLQITDNSNKFITYYKMVDITEVENDFEFFEVLEENKKHELYNDFKHYYYYDTFFYNYDEIQKAFDLILATWSNKSEKSKTCKNEYDVSEFSVEMKDVLKRKYNISIVGNRIKSSPFDKSTKKLKTIFQDFTTCSVCYLGYQYGLEIKINYLNRLKNQKSVFDLIKKIGGDYDSIVEFLDIMKDNREEYRYKKLFEDSAELREYVKKVVDFS